MKKVLIIEDEDSIRENISDALSLNDYEIFTAENGIEGVRLAKQINPDLILCDIMMPLLDGYGVLEAIKSDEKSTLIPFIFISAKSKHEDIRKGMNLGADDYLIKPFLLQDLLIMVEAKLAEAERIQKTYIEKQQDIIEQYGLIQMHEINTPMNGILTSVSLLQEMEIQSYPSEAAELLQIINFSSKRLHRSLSNIFFYKHLKDEKYAFYSETIRETSIKVAIENISKNYNRSSDLISLIDKHSIQFDRKLLTVIITELMDNAFKFTKENDQVFFSLLKIENAVEIKIQHCNRNNFEVQEFENSQPFRQFNKDKYEQTGIGLGLSIVKLIAEQYLLKLNYEISLNNIAIFTLIIPENTR
jgi:two-component system, sensor histidine kinase and response regulator